MTQQTQIIMVYSYSNFKHKTHDMEIKAELVRLGIIVEQPLETLLVLMQEASYGRPQALAALTLHTHPYLDFQVMRSIKKWTTHQHTKLWGAIKK